MTTNNQTPFLDAGVASFMNATQISPAEPDALTKAGVDVGVVGFPFDGTCISRTGANMGPRGIRAASTQTPPLPFRIRH